MFPIVLVITMFPIVVLKYCVNIVAENTIQIFVVKLKTATSESTNQEKNEIKSKSHSNQENVNSASAMHCSKSCSK